MLFEYMGFNWTILNMSIELLGQNYFYELIYKPSYCNFPESRKKNLKLFFYFIHRL